ncbi:Protein of unknown function [Streptomyces sp. DvalAA-14]|uniref:DUF4230 domain-containing protein n=1 Tax=unclassified Streptomyces TaxID=2593676 RepID=UPI00081BB3CF|nr:MULTISPECIES: DUF4230 domain-containing protein [unclassified Streptomyces]MYS19793.1 DUF4230 domain-containing protein [Streptomyces sp. SID4948]SCD53452.1 Protein of unknown function [Streptomyces sp. DvalAA-14]
METQQIAVTRTPWWAKIVIGVVVVGVLFFLLGRANLLPGIPNPFAEKTTDRSGPVLLKSIQDMNRFEGASGNFEVVVDVDKDAKFLPDIVRGKRTLYVGAGSVDAYVDLGSIGDNAVTVSDDRKTAAIRLPHAALERTSLDPKHSYVVSQQRGLFDRIGDFFGSNPGNMQQMNELAAQKIQDAAKQTELTTRAETNTRSMLQQMLSSLGFTKVTVTFGPPPKTATPSASPSASASPSTTAS